MTEIEETMVKTTIFDPSGKQHAISISVGWEKIRRKAFRPAFWAAYIREVNFTDKKD